MVEVGDAAPEFYLPTGDEHETCLNSYRGKWVILYFYPNAIPVDAPVRQWFLQQH